MDRLTYRSPKFNNPVSNGACKDITCSDECDSCKINDLIAKLCAYEDTGLEPEDVRRLQGDWMSLIMTLDEMGGMPHLHDLIQAEQDGRLVVLTCKVGDRVFHVRRVTQAEAKRMGVTPRYGRIIYYEDRPFAIKEKLCTKSDYAQIGKTVFLTREEAEAALKGGEG